MKKLRYVAAPVVIFVVAYFFQRSGYRRYGPDDPAVPANEVDWGSVVVTWLIATVAYFAIEAFRAHRKGQTSSDLSSR